MDSGFSFDAGTPRILAWLTDFGQRDWYVASMKAVATSICPVAQHIDITHEIEPGDVGSAAFVLEQCWRDFPVGTVFVVVVDPGGGTGRAPIAVHHEGRVFVGPDNGVCSRLWHEGWPPHPEVRRIANPAFYREGPSHTFHGRDIFAPAAARLALGWPFEKIGPRLPEPATLEAGPAFKRVSDREWATQVVFLDRFGNAICGLRQRDVEEFFEWETAAPGGPSSGWPCQTPRPLEARIGRRRLPFCKTYGEVKKGCGLAYWGSGGHLELALNGGHAAHRYKLRLGHAVRLVLGTEG